MAHVWFVDLVRIYQCLCDATRLRILHLLGCGPLCVCHLQQILDLPQTKVSQHLAYLRKHGMVECRRQGTWMVYRLPAKRTAELDANLRCLQDCAQTDQRLKSDRKALKKLDVNQPWMDRAACSGIKVNASNRNDTKVK